MGKLLASIVALRFHMAITPASIVRLARFLPHIRPLARRAKKRNVEDAVPYEAQTDFSAVGAGVPDSPMPVCRPSSGASSSQAPYRLAFSQARKLTHSAARPLKIIAAALILKRKTEGVDA